MTGRADPGFLQVEPKGHRGFQARAVYHWDGKAFIPAKTEYRQPGLHGLSLYFGAPSARLPLGLCAGGSGKIPEGGFAHAGCVPPIHPGQLAGVSSG